MVPYILAVRNRASVASMQNRLLSALPPAESARLEPHLELVPLTRGQALADTSEHLYFPVDSVVALLYELHDGASAEISLVGNEGVTGVAVALGNRSTLDRAIVQVAGHAYRVRADALHAEFSHDDDLQQQLFRFSRALLAQMAQTAACNWNHPPHQRLCRWLLLTLDRVPSNRLLMDRALISTILGLPQAAVDDAVAKLQRLGAVSASPAHIDVNNRPQLERLSCECYALVRGESDRLLQPASHHKLRSII